MTPAELETLWTLANNRVQTLDQIIQMLQLEKASAVRDKERYRRELDDVYASQQAGE